MLKVCANSKQIKSTVVLLVLAFPAVLFSQKAASNSPATQKVEVSPTAGNVGLESQTLKELTNKLPNLEQGDSFDFENGTFTWKGKTFDIGNSRMVRSRFERYLNNRSDSDQITSYQSLLNDVFRLLAVTGSYEKKTENIESAWNLLPEMANYNCDGQNSLVVATYVFNAFRARADLMKNDISIRHASEMQKRLIQSIDSRQAIEAESTSNRVASALAAMSRAKDPRFAATPSSPAISGKKSAPNQTGNSESPTSLVETPNPVDIIALAQSDHKYGAKKTELHELGEVARLRTIAEGNYSTLRTHLDFQGAMVNFLLERRYQHALLLVRFYNQLFKSSHQSLEVGKEQLSYFMQNMASVSPTVSTVEMICREAMTDVNKGMESVYIAMENDEKFLAFERLQEVFYLGEFTPEVLSFPEPYRRDIYKLYKKIQELQQLLDLKDYAAIEPVVAEIKTIAKDFPDSKILSVSRSAQRMSDVSLLSAQQYFLGKDYIKGEEYLTRSAEIWPLNPAIKKFTEGMVSSSVGTEQGKIIFDQMSESKNYREIYNRRAELGLALSIDVERADALKAVLERVSKIDILIAQSKEMLAQKNPYGAWECLVLASDLDPDDILVNKEKIAVVPNVTSFIDKLSKAERAENEGFPAVALSHYVAANDEYPMSQLCRKGIERNTAAYLARIRKNQNNPSAK